MLSFGLVVCVTDFDILERRRFVNKIDHNVVQLVHNLLLFYRKDSYMYLHYYKSFTEIHSPLSFMMGKDEAKAEDLVFVFSRLIEKT